MCYPDADRPDFRSAHALLVMTTAVAHGGAFGNCSAHAEPPQPGLADDPMWPVYKHVMIYLIHKTSSAERTILKTTTVLKPIIVLFVKCKNFGEHSMVLEIVMV